MTAISYGMCTPGAIIIPIDSHVAASASHNSLVHGPAKNCSNAMHPAAQGQQMLEDVLCWLQG